MGISTFSASMFFQSRVSLLGPLEPQQEKYEYWSLLVSDHWSFQAAYKNTPMDGVDIGIFHFYLSTLM